MRAMGSYHSKTFEGLTYEKQRVVLDAAADEFAQLGFAGANVNRVAERAGVAVGSIYKYFGSKENCFLAVLEDGLEELEDFLVQIEKSGLSPLEKIETVAKLIPDHSRRRAVIVRLYNELSREGASELILDFCRRFEGASARAYTRILSDAKKDGLIHPSIDENVFAFCLDNLFTMLQFSYASDYYKERRRAYLPGAMADDDQHVLEQMIQFITTGLRGPQS